MTTRNQVRPDIIMDKVYGLIPGLALLAGLQTDIFSRLGDRSMDGAALAASMAVNPERLLPLLNALTASGLLEKEAGMFSNSPETARFLVREKSGYRDHITGLIRKVLEAVPKTAHTILFDVPQAKMDWTGLPESRMQAFQKNQYHGSIQAGKELGAALDFSECGRVLDAAGGTGGLAVGLARAWPDLHITVADLPEMAKACRERISSLGLARRIAVADADLVNGPPRGRFDTVILRSFLQVLSPGDAQAVLGNIRPALLPGGRLCITGYFVDNTQLFPPGAVAHNLVFLNLYERGRAHTEGEYRTWLSRAGFSAVEVRYGVFSDGAGMITALRD